MRVFKFIAPLLVALVAWTPVQAKKETPLTVAGATTIDAAEAKKLFDAGVVFIDVRSDSDFEAGRIPGAKHLNSKTKLSEAELLKVVKKDQQVVMYCNGSKCSRSSKSCAK
ncbi:MAG: rhodanese-like domain-containing protein, partial [Alphaproteobacteria bacterium]